MSKKNGFTFIELFIVIILIGILIGVSVPTFRNTFNNIHLNSFSSELQAFMNYLRERSIVERKIISFNIDTDKKEYWAQIKDATDRLKSRAIPDDLKIEADQNQIFFYPDGQIDKITLKITNPSKQSITLTTKGVFGSVKLQTQK